jgi:hypothetical protein
MALTVNPTLPVIAAQPVGGAATGIVLQPGTVVNAQVVAAAENLVQIAIAGLTIDVLSEIPLIAGQNLQLAVSQADSGTIRLAVVGQGVAGASAATGAGATPDAPSLAPPDAPSAIAALANDPLTPLERVAVSVASETAVTRQESLAPLFANLNALTVTNSLPPALQQAVVQVLAQQTSLDPNLSGDEIQSAFQKSGLFLEASLAAGSIQPSGGVPDLKAALIVLRQTLAAAVAAPETPTVVAPATLAAPAGEAKPTPSAQMTASRSLAPSQVLEAGGHEILPPQTRAAPVDEATPGNTTKLLLTEALLSAGPRSVTSGAALNLLQEALQEIPPVAGNATATSVTLQDGYSADAATVHTNTPPPPFRGALPSPQPVAASTIAPDAPLTTAVRHLLDDTDAALARQTLLQVASLPDRPDATSMRVDPSMPRWNFEIPFATAQGTAMAQFEISRDGGGAEVDPAKRVWRARFSLDVEPAGPVHALVAYSDQRTSVRVWAERPQTAAQLRAGAAELSQALAQAQLSPGDIVIREGAPPQIQPAKAGHFLDRAL